jgi:hypothetical protein
MRKREKPKVVMIGTPSLDGKVWFDYLNSYVHSIVLAANAGWSVQTNCMTGNSLINYARAIIGQDFMESDCDSLFFIDADLRWEAKAFVRILESEEDVICGVYPCRAPGKKKFPSRGLFNGHPSLMETRGAPGGFIRVTRKAMRKMQKAYPELKASYRGRTIHMLWEPMLVEGEPLGEDFAFCERWHQIGGKVMIDPDINFGHFGTFVYEGNLAQAMKE